MKVLAVDTSSKYASVAVIEDGRIIKELFEESEREHSETLMPMIKNILDEVNLKLEDFDLYACGVGPGSFTGIRIGIATIKAFSDAYNIPLVGINSLEAQAYCAVIKNENKDCKILSMIDAKNENAYTAVYRMHDGNFSVYKNPGVLEITDSIEYINFEDLVFVVGDVPLEKIEILMQVKISKEIAQAKNVNGYYEYIEKPKSLASMIGIASINKYKRKIYGNSSTISPMYLRKPQAERQNEGLQDEKIYMLEMIDKDLEEIRDHYEDFPNMWTIEQLEQDTKNSKYIVAKQNSEIIGFIGFRRVLDEIEIMNIVTRRDKQKQGVASSLISYVVRKGKATKINLEVNENNITARNLYSKFGFRQVGLRSRYYNGQDDAILMTL